jgi:hypothetical protein
MFFRVRVVRDRSVPLAPHGAAQRGALSEGLHGGGLASLSSVQLRS